MLENLIVGLVVAAAAWHAARRLLPAKLRARLLGKAATAKGDCASGCGSCGGCEPAPPLDLEDRAAAGSPDQAPGQRGAGQGAARDGGPAQRPAGSAVEHAVQHAVEHAVQRRIIRLHPVPAK